MAKWGEGDPRWIVEERADAVNVNNWHWTEKNATPWSSQRLRTLMHGLVFEDSKYHVEVTEVTSVEGEATASNRKGKLFFFYEWEIKADWEGYLKSDSAQEKHKGDLLIPNLSEEHPVEDVDIDIALKENPKEGAFEVKEYMRREANEVVRNQLQTYIDDLKHNFSQGMILPTKDILPPPSTTPKTTPKSGSKVSQSRELGGAIMVSSVDSKCSGELKDHRETIEFKCTADEIYSVFLDKHKLEAFTRGPVEMEARVGGRFSLFDSNVSGVISQLIANESLQLQWRFKSWPCEHFSQVSLLFLQKNDCTAVTLTQTGIPANDYERTMQGWKNYYWESIKNTFGFGAMLF